jgi:hypothetical protein
MTNIFFKSAQHKERFVSTMQRLGKIYESTFDPEYAAAIYILTADLSTSQKSSEYMGCHGIDFDTLLKEVDFSGSYSVLIELAGNLFNGQRHIDPLEFLRLDGGNFNVAITALLLRRNGYRVEQEGAEHGDK